MSDWLKANKMYLLLGVLIMAALAIYYFMPNKAENEKNEETEWEESALEPNQQDEKQAGLQEKAEVKETIMVDVKGAVVKPGVYEAKFGDRVIDIIHLAGGLLENADQNQINFAMKVEDEMVLYLPVQGEEAHPHGGAATSNFSPFSASSSSEDQKVNLNSASESELQTLTGIGPSKAAAIIEYRDKNGRFKEIEQLKEISGIGDKTFEKLKEEITVR